MALQTAIASEFVQRSQEQFRIKQTIESEGDVYEIDTSLRGFVIGPESDVAEVIVHYFDKSEPSLVQSQSVSIRNPFTGRLDAIMNSAYADELPAQVLVTLGDIIDQAYVPDVSGPPFASPIARFPAVVDIQGYFAEPQQLPSERSDKRFSLSVIEAPVAPDVYSYVVIPYYGRRYANVLLRNPDDTAPGEMVVYGVRLGQGLTIPDQLPNKSETVLATLPVPDDTTVNEIILATEDGMYDLLMVRLELDSYDNVSLRIDVSDREA